jgi:hypothetical protein
MMTAFGKIGTNRTNPARPTMSVVRAQLGPVSPWTGQRCCPFLYRPSRTEEIQRVSAARTLLGGANFDR